MKKIQVLPNLITLANAFCGLLAMAKVIDALAVAAKDDALFYPKMETACFLIFLGMVFDALDGFIARLLKSDTPFGAQLDSFSDVLTFGAAPALIAKALIEHEGPLLGYHGFPRLHFLGAAFFTLMAILRLVRFNLETREDDEGHGDFHGLPSPGAAGAIASTVWIYLILRRPELESSEGQPTPFGHVMGWMRTIDWSPALAWVPPLLALMLPAVGLLMVSRIRYAHLASSVARARSQFFVLVWVIAVVLVFYLAPVPFLFALFNGYLLHGLIVGGRAALTRSRADRDREWDEEVEVP